MIQNNEFSKAEYHIININDGANLNINTQKQHFCEVTDVFCSVATFLDTKDLTRFFSISRTFSASLSDLPEIKQILLYNHSQKRRNWKLLGKYDYNNHISRQRIKNSGLIGAHYIQKSNEVLKKEEFNKNHLWSIEGGTQVLMCGVGLYILLQDCFLYSSRHHNLNNACISLFNQTHICDSNIYNVTNFLIDNDLPKISLEEQIELKNLNYLRRITGRRMQTEIMWLLFIQPIITSFGFESPSITNPNLYRIIEDYKDFNPLKLMINYLNFIMPLCEMLVLSYKDKDLSDSNDKNNIIFNSFIIYQSLNLINFLNTVAIIKRPYLRKKMSDCATEKIKQVYSSIFFYEPRLIKKIRYNSLALGESALIKIKSAFQYIGSCLSGQDRIHHHNS